MHLSWSLVASLFLSERNLIVHSLRYRWRRSIPINHLKKIKNVFINVLYLFITEVLVTLKCRSSFGFARHLEYKEMFMWPHPLVHFALWNCDDDDNKMILVVVVVVHLACTTERKEKQSCLLTIVNCSKWRYCIADKDVLLLACICAFSLWWLETFYTAECLSPAESWVFTWFIRYL